MVRALIIFAFAALGASVAALLVGNPGQITVDWFGYRLETAMSLMAIMLLVVFLVALLALRLVALVLGGPAAWRAFFDRLRARQGMGALTQGLAAAAAGDANEARRHAIAAERLTGEGSLARVLALEAAELEGRIKDITQLATGMLEQPETSLLGHRALFDLARKGAREKEAVDEAEAAFETHPAAGWAAEALLADAIEAQDWVRARSVFARADRHNGFINGRASRTKAALKLAEATQLRTDGEDHKALVLARKAQSEDDTFSPAPLMMAALLGGEGKIKRAQEVIEKAWIDLPHPAMGRIYAELFPNERQVETLGRLRALISLNAGHTESRLLFAHYAIAARNFPAGRDALKGLLQDSPSSRALALMGALDRAELGMAEVSEDWITKALSAPRDAVWVCSSCGHHQEEWTAVCGRCRTIGRLEWATHMASIEEKAQPRVEMDTSIGLEASPDPVAEPEALASEHAEPEQIEAPKEGHGEPDTTAFEEGSLQPDDPGPDESQGGKGSPAW